MRGLGSIPRGKGKNSLKKGEMSMFSSNEKTKLFRGKGYHPLRGRYPMHIKHSLDSKKENWVDRRHHFLITKLSQILRQFAFKFPKFISIYIRILSKSSRVSMFIFANANHRLPKS